MRTIRSLDDQLLIADRLARPEHLRHRRLFIADLATIEVELVGKSSVSSARSGSRPHSLAVRLLKPRILPRESHQ
jgi:hypothetical protein